MAAMQKEMTTTPTKRTASPRRKRATTAENKPKASLYKVKVSDDFIILKHRAIIAHNSYAVVNAEELEQLKEMGLIADGE